MRRILSLVALVAAASLSSPASAQTVIIFVDGTRQEVQSYEVKENLVLFTTLEGKLRSVPKDYVDLAAMEGASAPPRRESPPAPPPREPAPAAPTPAPPPPMPTESIELEPPVEPITPSPSPPPAPPAPPADVTTAPPPVWSNDELQVSLVVPSSSWEIDELPPSFDVAVALENEVSDARATLALIRKELRGRRDFQNVVSEVRSSIAQAPGYRSIEDGPTELDPYTAHEFRFVKSVEGSTSYNRLLVVYSRDLAYILSLTCPEARRAENDADFEALVRGLVVKKPRNQLSF